MKLYDLGAGVTALGFLLAALGGYLPPNEGDLGIFDCERAAVTNAAGEALYFNYVDAECAAAGYENEDVSVPEPEEEAEAPAEPEADPV